MVIQFSAVWAAYPRCLPTLVGYVCYRSDTGRRWFAPIRKGDTTFKLTIGGAQSLPC